MFSISTSMMCTTLNQHSTMPTKQSLFFKGKVVPVL